MHIQVLSAAKHLFYRMFNICKQNKATQIFSVSQEKWFTFFNDLHSHTEQKNLIQLLITHLIKIKSNLTIDQQKKCLTPARKALMKSDMNYEVVLIDATESHIERPKKTKILLFRKEEKVYTKNSNSGR